jgi:hypothetical protein
MSQSGIYTSSGGVPVGSILTLTGNTGGPVGPDVSGNINLVGAGVISVTGNPGTDTLTISISGSGGTNEFETDSGTAAPASGIIDIHGGSNINTSGATNVVTINLDNTVSISGSMTAGTGFIATTGDVNIEAGNLDLPTTLSDASEGVININSVPFIQNLAGNIIVGQGAGNFTFNTSLAVKNIIVGEGAFGDVTTGNNNVVIGVDSTLTGTSATNNVIIGANTAGGITSGSGNILIGEGTGSTFLSTESNNIVIGNPASAAIQNTIIIGNQGSGSQQQNTCFIAGILGNSVPNTELVTIDSGTGQLGVTAIDSFANTFDTDSGTAIPLDGVIDIAGGSNINTSGGTNVVTVNLDNNVTISGNYTSTAGLIALPTTSSTAGQITINSTPAFHTYGTGNTFLGASAGNFTLTTGSATNNLGVGTNALHALTTGNFNTALGYNAGAALATGLGNVLIGTNSGQAVTDNGSTAVGLDTLSTATLASESTAIGAAALMAYTTATTPGNTAIGSQALASLKTGRSNCVIGAYNLSGQNYTGSESSNILIQNQGTASESNVIRIGTQGSSLGQQNTCYIAGIIGNAVSNEEIVTINSSTGQLGVTAFGTFADSFVGDSGTATPSSGVMNLKGTANQIVTTASGNTVTSALASSISISGNYTSTGGLVALPTTSSTAGQITINSSPVLHTFGTGNIFLGSGAGNFTMTAVSNVAIGTQALAAMTTVGANTAVGNNAGLVITSSGQNTLIGAGTGKAITTGSGNNTCVGYHAGFAFTTGTQNTLIGVTAGVNYTGSESSNICIGNGGTVSESNVIRIGVQGSSTGQQNQCFIAGITGVTVTGSAVLCSTTGALGTISSSIRYKENVKDIKNKSADILSLRPVLFNYKTDDTKAEHYGLIAEEVEEIFPTLVLRGEDGKAESVAYHELPVLLLNELKKALKRIDELEARL